MKQLFGIGKFGVLKTSWMIAIVWGSPGPAVEFITCKRAREAKKCGWVRVWRSVKFYAL